MLLDEETITYVDLFKLLSNPNVNEEARNRTHPKGLQKTFAHTNLISSELFSLILFSTMPEPLFIPF